MKAMRDAFGEAIVALGELEPRVVVLDADVSNSTRTMKFAQKFPDRFINVGIAEANMIGIAAGLATMGYIPFASSFSLLTCLRAGDQVRTSVAYPRLNVKIVGGYAGLSPSYDGPSHHSIADISVMRALPNMTVIVPADETETRKAVFAAARLDGPVFLRLSRGECPRLFDESSEFVIGRGRVVRPGEDLAIMTCGILLAKALKAAQRLREQGISARVLEIHTIKPIDTRLIEFAGRETGAIVTAEEHNVLGGLGSAVSEVVAESCPVPIVRVGIRDTFAESGGYEDLLNLYGLSEQSIVDASHEVLRKKRGRP